MCGGISQNMTEAVPGSLETELLFKTFKAASAARGVCVGTFVT